MAPLVRGGNCASLHSSLVRRSSKLCSSNAFTKTSTTLVTLAASDGASSPFASASAMACQSKSPARGRATDKLLKNARLYTKHVTRSTDQKLYIRSCMSEVVFSEAEPAAAHTALWAQCHSGQKPERFPSPRMSPSAGCRHWRGFPLVKPCHSALLCRLDARH